MPYADAEHQAGAGSVRASSKMGLGGGTGQVMAPVLFGWMAIMAFVLFPAPHHLMPSSAAYWLLMQIGMIVGYFTSWPANVWLVNRGIKVPM
jgi:hypothetical protein